MKLVLVSCSSQKLKTAAPARDLYTSQLFKLSRAYAEASGDGWAILSAKHGLVQPWRELEPYDCAFADLARGQRDEWGWRVAASFDALCLDAGVEKGVTPVGAVLLAGKDYTERLVAAWGSRMVQGKFAPTSVATPLAGLGVGQRLVWLKARLAERRAVSQ